MLVISQCIVNNGNSENTKLRSGKGAVEPKDIGVYIFGDWVGETGWIPSCS